MAIGTAAAIIGGSIIGAGASMIGSSQAAGATKDAAKAATNAELQMYNQSRTDLAPWRDRGTQALDQLAQLYGLPAMQTPAAPRATPAQTGTAATYGAAPATRDLSAFYKSPQYNFVKDEGMDAIKNLASTRGGIGGNVMREGARFGTGLASGEFNSYVDRLMGIAGLGSGATSTGVAANQNTAGTLASIYTGAGNARASSYLAGAGGVNNAIQGGLQNWAFTNYLNKPGSGDVWT